jgi:hypothetical protein
MEKDSGGGAKGKRVEGSEASNKLIVSQAFQRSERKTGGSFIKRRERES